MLQIQVQRPLIYVTGSKAIQMYGSEVKTYVSSQWGSGVLLTDAVLTQADSPMILLGA